MTCLLMRIVSNRMLSPSAITPEAVLSKQIENKFPTITDFRIDTTGRNTKPVDAPPSYHETIFDGRRYRKPVKTYPPVAYWKIGTVQYAYVPEVKFKKKEWSNLLAHGAMYHPDYSEGLEQLLLVIQWTVEGKTQDEMNRLLGNSWLKPFISDDI